MITSIKQAWANIWKAIKSKSGQTAGMTLAGYIIYQSSTQSIASIGMSDSDTANYLSALIVGTIVSVLVAIMVGFAVIVLGSVVWGIASWVNSLFGSDKKIKGYKANKSNTKDSDDIKSVNPNEEK